MVLRVLVIFYVLIVYVVRCGLVVGLGFGSLGGKLWIYMVSVGFGVFVVFLRYEFRYSF